MSHFLAPLLDDGVAATFLRNRRNQRVVAAHVETAFESESRRRGLLGRDRMPEATALVIAPCSSIHTWFMRFPIDVAFVRRDGRVLKIRPALPAWRMTFGWRAFAVVELAAGVLAASDTRVGDLLEVVTSEAGVGSPRG